MRVLTALFLAFLALFGDEYERAVRDSFRKASIEKCLLSNPQSINHKRYCECYTDYILSYLDLQDFRMIASDNKAKKREISNKLVSLIPSAVEACRVHMLREFESLLQNR